VRDWVVIGRALVATEGADVALFAISTILLQQDRVGLLEVGIETVFAEVLVGLL